MKRVMIVGGPGSGKSTLAVLLGKRTGLPVYHMDHIHWKSGWVGRSMDGKSRLSNAVHARDEWIFEGGHSRTYDERLRRADTLIWLDFPLYRRLFRVAKRTIVHFGKNRADLPEGCVERINGETFEFFKFIIRTSRASKAKHQVIMDNPPPHLSCIRLGSLKEVREFLLGPK